MGLIITVSSDLFNKTGNVDRKQGRNISPRWPAPVYEFARAYIKDHPCFYLDELKEAIAAAFPDLTNVSVPTVCRAVRHDMNLIRKKLEKHAREARPQELADYKVRLGTWY